MIIPPLISVREHRGQETQVPLAPLLKCDQALPSSPRSPCLSSIVPHMVAHLFRLGQQGDNKQFKEVAGTGAKGAPSSPLQDNEASAPQGQPL